MSLLDSLFGVQHVYRSGVEFVRRKAFDFVGSGWSIADNPETGRTELGIDVPALGAEVRADEQFLDELAETLKGDPQFLGELATLAFPTVQRHLLVNSTGTAVVDSALLAGRDPGNTHVIVRFSGNGAKKLVIARDLASGAPAGMRITVFKSAGSSSIAIEATDGALFDGQSGEVLVQPTVADSRSFTITPVGNPPNWFFLGQPRVDGPGGVLLSSAEALVSPNVVRNSAIGYTEELGARRSSGSGLCGVSVLHRVSRANFSGSPHAAAAGLSTDEVSPDCAVIAEVDLALDEGFSFYAGRLIGVFRRVSGGAFQGVSQSLIGGPLPGPLATVGFSPEPGGSGATIYARATQHGSLTWTMTARARYTVMAK